MEGVAPENTKDYGAVTWGVAIGLAEGELLKTSFKLLLLLAGLIVPASALAASTETDWRQMGFSPKGNRFNPRETVLNAGNVANLSLAWTEQTGDVIRSRARYR